jgi:hypothetical protein
MLKHSIFFDIKEYCIKYLLMDEVFF